MESVSSQNAQAPVLTKKNTVANPQTAAKAPDVQTTETKTPKLQTDKFEPSKPLTPEEEKQAKTAKIKRALVYLAVAGLAAFGVTKGVKAGVNAFKNRNVKKLADVSFSDGIAFKKGKNEKFNGIIKDKLNSGNTIEMTYKNGRIESSVKTSKKGKPIHTKTFEYNENGNISKTITNGKEVKRVYNDNGMISEITSGKRKTTFEYNEDGHLATLNKNGKKTIIEYNDDGTIKNINKPGFFSAIRRSFASIFGRN